MKKILILTTFALFLPLGAWAQWRVGIGGGFSYNRYSMDRQYMTDYTLKGATGFHGGIIGQYTFTDWLAVRAEFDLTQRNWGMDRTNVSSVDVNYINTYVLMPIMASLSWGGPKLRGFVNLGEYQGYWMYSYRYGKERNSFSHRDYSYSERVEFNKEKDQRWDYGLIAGLGIEFHFARHWAVQWEARYWHSLESQVKQYMMVKDYRYNNTFTAQVSMFYCF